MAEYPCPHCHQPICDDDALLCLYCGESLKRRVGVLAILRQPRPAVLGIAAIIVLVLGFLFATLR